MYGHYLLLEDRLRAFLPRSQHHELPPVNLRAPTSVVLTASPAPAVRKRWLQGLQGTTATCEVADQAALEQRIKTLTPAMLLLDLAILRLGIEGVLAVQRLSPPTRIVVFNSPPNEREAIAALKAGARGYHGRDIAPDLLKKAVQAVQKGEIWVGRNVIAHLLEELTSIAESRKLRKLDGRLAHLTARELEVARLVGDGFSNKEIASHLNVSEKTAKAHLTAIFRKLGLSDRLRLALFVSEHSRASC